MDYRTIINQLNILKSDYNDYFNERKQKNERDVDDIVKTYLEALSKGVISLQSFKTRILHNGRNVEKLIPIIKNRINALNVEFGTKEDYIKISESQKVSPTKKYDLQDFALENRKNRHEINNKIVALEKEISKKMKDNALEIEESIKVHQQNILELTKNMNAEVQIINATMEKDVAGVQIGLLDENNIVEIKKLKKVISDIRLKALNDIYKTKKEYLLKIKDEKIIVVAETAKQDLFNKEIKDESSITISEYNFELEKLRIEEKAKNILYDFESEISNLDNVLDKKILCLNIIRKHNEKLLTVEDIYIGFDKLKVNLLQAIIIAKEENQYNPYIKVFEKILDIVEEIKKMFIDCFSSLDNKIKEYQEQIFNSFEEVARNLSFKRNRSKDDIKVNILDCLKLLYENESKLYDNYLCATYDLINNISNKACNILSEEINKLGYNSLFINECSYDFDIYMLGYQKVNFSDQEVYKNVCEKNDILNNTIIMKIDDASNFNNICNERVDKKINDFIRKSSLEVKKLCNTNKKSIKIMRKAVKRLIDNKDRSVLHRQNLLIIKSNREIIQEKRELKKQVRLLA